MDMCSILHDGIYGLSIGQFYWPYYAYNLECRIEVIGREGQRSGSPATYDLSPEISLNVWNEQKKRSACSYGTITTIYCLNRAKNYTLNLCKPQGGKNVQVQSTFDTV